MKRIFQKVIDFFDKGKYTTNENAAAIIRRFIHGTGDPYEWDDFESVDHTNPDVDLAIKLCWFFAGEFPAKKPTEYCDQRADTYFLKIADALENNQFHDMDHEAVKESLKKNELPKSVSSILSIKDLNKDVNQ